MTRLLHILQFVCFLAGIMPTGYGQQIWVEPEFPLAGQPAIVYFDAKQCDCPLVNYSGSVYAHTGIIKATGTTWQNVIGTWGNNAVQPQLRPVGNQVYALDINPSIAGFYKEPNADDIRRMAFVFRSSDGGQQTADLFIDVFQAGQARIVSPAEDQIFGREDSVTIDVVALGADSILVEVNGDEITSAEGSLLKYTFFPTSSGENTLEVQVRVNGQTVALTRNFYVVRSSVVAPIPAEFEHLGFNPIPGDNAALFVLPAPGKSFAFITGDFNDWGIGEEYQMNQSPDQNYFWIRIDGLDPDEEYAYQYIIDGNIKVADPFTKKVLDDYNDPWIPENIYPGLKDYPYNKTTGIVSTFQLNEEPYEWKTQRYAVPAAADLQIYELLVRDFVEDHSYQSVLDSLDYLQSIGINAIELMPVMEFEGNSSWGYNTSFHFALDKYYGTPNDLKAIIDECHARGMAVILDIVINHAYGQNPMVRMYWDNERSRPAEDSPWFNPVSPNQVFSFGYDFDHESTYTVDYFNEVLDYWLREFRVDGYRLDFTKGLTNRPGDGGAYDASRIRILKAYADHVWQSFPDAYMILEHFAPANEERELAEHGMLVWGNHNHNFNQIAMGYQSGSNFSYASYQERGMDEPMVVTYMESHDEERMMFKTGMWGNQSGEYDIKELTTGLERAKMATLLWMSVPGPKLIWMFDELGYDISIDDPCRVCEKPILWNYLDDPRRLSLKEHYASLFRLRTEHDVFSTRDFSINASSAVKWVYLKGSDNQVLSVANTDVLDQRVSIPVDAGNVWTDYFTGAIVDGKNGMIDLQLAPGEYMLLSVKPFRQIERSGSDLEFRTGSVPGELTVSSIYPIRRIHLYDLAGREIYSVGNIGSTEHTVSFDTGGLSGIFLLMGEDENGYKESFKWVITP